MSNRWRHEREAVQRVARSIVPNRMREDSSTNEDSLNNENRKIGSGEQALEANPTRKRRSSRRVIRGTGAADANVPMQVEASKEEDESSRRNNRRTRTRMPGEYDQEASSNLNVNKVDVAELLGDEESSSRSRNTRTSKQSKAKQSGESRRHGKTASKTNELPIADSDEGNTESRRSSRTRRKMESHNNENRSSQRSRIRSNNEEPTHDPETSEAYDAPAGTSHVTQAPRAQSPAKPMTSLLFQEPVIPKRVNRELNIERDEEENSNRDDERSSARKTRTRKTRANAKHTVQREERESEQDIAEEIIQPRRKRARRLNAEERQAAEEVELIEQDLLEESEREAAAEAEISNSRRQFAVDDDEDESALTRRRRRRRSSKDTEDDQPVRRSRRQQYVDEITDVEGSTRLEAKKQRRRDNRRERSRQTQLIEQDFLARRESVNRLMVVREKNKHTQISVIEDDILVEHYISDIDEVSAVGNIYLGRVQNVLPSMEAAFVDIGQARNGVLYAGEVNWDFTRLEGQPRRIELAFKSGDPVLVQVTKDSIGHKGARLTSQVTLAGRFLVLVPSGGMTGVSRKLSDSERSRLKSIVARIAPKDVGVIIRTAADGASEEAIEKDLENLQRQWEEIESKREEFLHGKRPKLLQGEPDVAIRVVRDIFNDDFEQLIVEGDRVYDHIQHYLTTRAPELKDKLVRWDPAEHQGKDVFDKWGIDSQLRKGMERQVYLRSGGSLVIDRTEAMTTVDVNTGRFIGKGKSLEDTVTRCNLEAAEEIARQLRLRDIGGMVMIDFVDMVMPANRDLVLRRLVECLARDRTKHQVAEVTSLGLVQMTRKRVGQGLVEAFSEECPTCKGRGFILHDEPTVSTKYDDPYAVKGGDPFTKGVKHDRNTKTVKDTAVPQGSSSDVKAKLAQIAAAAEKASEEREAIDDLEPFDQELSVDETVVAINPSEESDESHEQTNIEENDSEKVE